MTFRYKDGVQGAAIGPVCLFVFTYNEHELLELALEPSPAVLLEHARRQGWSPASESYPLAEDCRDSLEELGDSAASFFVRAPDLTPLERSQSEELVRVPFEKLTAKLSQEGWVFVGGLFSEFEGNHDDTKIYVALRRPG